MARRQQLRILCFGDSLTSGFHDFGLATQPYALRLEERLVAALPHVDVQIVVSGVPGDVATFETFAKRLANQYDQHGPFDWAIILGGTNDLAYGISAAKILDSLQKVWNIALERGSKVLALTVPETELKAERLVGRRDELNLSILTNQQENYYFFDLEAALPYHALDEEDRQRYWDDGVHLSSQGYDRMGELIANALLRVLPQESEPSAPQDEAKAPVKTVRQAPDDDLAFDEEEGNPRNINQGYIVVRKRDLE